MRFTILPMFFLASKVLCDGQAIVDAISEIANTTTSLNQTVSIWSGSLLTSLPIITFSAKLLIDINTGTWIASSSANLTLIETITIATATQNLVTVVEETLDTIVSAKPKFNKLLFSPLILLDLVEEKSATDTFSAKIIEKIPEAFQETARAIVAPVDTAFDAAIADYKFL
ncbi:uncharacterized protein EAF01_004609 [Botrytis porri]|uniref:Antigenic cell wall galactomannoprotein n=1 Tax=Botrytis porri TaxID=87229 RepID=A0A4Z1L141_9HELO|nr:uncharacterized protein EAF01_004609 [Botrytis porri]KAF7907022.1 hypothetical protein EAF01_004609 [Botrytis porri]TGO90539.1 hypothetical protein BPOR_0060g00120 [Botrytis porri]